MTYPVFATGDVLNASDMNAVGLWLVGKQTIGTGVTSVTVTSAFGSDFENYRIVISGMTCSVSDTTLFVRPGANTTAASYFSGGFFVLFNGTGNGWLNNNGTTDGIAIGITSTTTQSVAFDILNPNQARWTRAMGIWSGDLYVGQYSGVHKVATAYTSFELRPASGTLTGGTIRIYGYRD